MTKFEFEIKTEKQLRSSYNSKKQKGLNDFANFEEFLGWYNKALKKCSYCGIEEEVLQELIIKGKITSKRFPVNGVPQRGKSRGMWLEIDRIDPDKNYSLDNVALCCYFCNNDKSDVFTGKDYKYFFQNRAEYLKNLLNND
jgi:hypothetical protein